MKCNNNNNKCNKVNKNIIFNIWRQISMMKNSDNFQILYKQTCLFDMDKFLKSGKICVRIFDHCTSSIYNEKITYKKIYKQLNI